jgi:hypothetical protein
VMFKSFNLGSEPCLEESRQIPSEYANTEQFTCLQKRIYLNANTISYTDWYRLFLLGIHERLTNKINYTCSLNPCRPLTQYESDPLDGFAMMHCTQVQQP